LWEKHGRKLKRKNAVLTGEPRTSRKKKVQKVLYPLEISVGRVCLIQTKGGKSKKKKVGALGKNQSEGEKEWGEDLFKPNPSYRGGRSFPFCTEKGNPLGGREEKKISSKAKRDPHVSLTARPSG